MKDATLSDLLIKVNIKTDNQLMVVYYYSWQDCPAYIVFYQGGTTDHGTHVTGPVTQSSA